MNPSRRKFIGNAATLSATALVVERLAGASHLLASDRNSSVDRKLLPGEKEVWEQVLFMNNLGVRFSGSPAHQKYVQFLENQFSALGLQIDRIPHASLVRWDLRRCSLAVASGPQAGKELSVSSYCRYCATTGPQGVTGELVYCGKASGPSGFSTAAEPDAPHTSPAVPADMQGKIALIEVAAEPLPYGAMWKGHVRAVYNSEGPSDFPAVEKTVAAYGAARLPAALNADIEKAGAIGVVYAWNNLSDDNAAGQMKNGSAGLPQLWVGRTAGDELRQLAAGGGRVTLTVEADIVPNVPTHTTLATLPGVSSDEVILLWSHTDGNNAIEENGGIAILNLMKYFSRLPHSKRKRTITCVLSEAHFNEQFIPTTAWIKERPELVAKAVAEVSIEHLGCGEWIDDPKANAYKGTGGPELAFAFCPRDPLSQVMLDSLQGTNSGKTVVIDTEVNAFSPAIWGYRISKIPLIGFIITPPYLLSEAPRGHIEKLSSRRYHEQMIAFANVIHRLDAIPRADLASHSSVGS